MKDFVNICQIKVHYTPYVYLFLLFCFGLYQLSYSIVWLSSA